MLHCAQRPPIPDPDKATDAEIGVLIVQLDARGIDCAARLKDTRDLLKEKGAVVE